jgi:2-hydroxy-4-carboxymuconate semialdehyde hemiacetal dehydrogenase
MKIVLAGAGAFGIKHLDAIKVIGGINVVSLVGRELEPTRATAAKYGIPHVTTDLGEALAQPGVEAAILCTPTQLHAAQASMCRSRSHWPTAGPMPRRSRRCRSKPA